MNPEVTSKEAILRACRKIAAEQGLPALSMRAVAGECGVALGTLYHYFPGKDALLLAAVESVWQDIFHTDGACEPARSFPDYAARLYRCARKGAEEYPNFLTAHSTAIAGTGRGEGRDAMERVFGHMRTGLLAALRADPEVDPAVFSPAFTENDLAELVLDHILLLLVKGAPDCTALTELVRRAIEKRS